MGSEKKEWKIPAKAQENIKRLCKEDDINTLKLEHNKHQHEDAVKRGEFELAYSLWREKQRDLHEVKKATHKKLWNAIYDSLPELDRDAPYQINPQTYLVTPSRGGGMPGLSEMFARAGG